MRRIFFSTRDDANDSGRSGLRPHYFSLSPVGWDSCSFLTVDLAFFVAGSIRQFVATHAEGNRLSGTIRTLHPGPVLDRRGVRDQAQVCNPAGDRYTFLRSLSSVSPPSISSILRYRSWIMATARFSCILMGSWFWALRIGT